MLISIVSPCFKAEKYLLDTYKSLVSQTHSNWEWIVVDDCSNDSSWEILQNLAKSDARLKTFRLSFNSGPSVCRNKGLNEAVGDYIAFLDVDDKWHSQKLEVQLNHMLSHDIDMSCHSYTIISDDNRKLKDVVLPYLIRSKKLRIYNPLATSFMMIKKSVIDNIQFDESLRRRQDWVFWYQVIHKVGNCYNIQQVLGEYRTGSLHSISKNKIQMAIIQWDMYRKYFKLSLIASVRNFLIYAFYGIRKHFGFKQLLASWI